jgi:hypothetical protein
MPARPAPHCARPAGSADRAGSAPRSPSSKAACQHTGLTLPSPSASGGGFRDLFTELQSNPADQAAFNACKSDLPFTPGSGGGYGGSGSGSGGGSNNNNNTTSGGSTST